MKKLLILAHAPSKNTQQIVENIADAIGSLSDLNLNLSILSPLDANEKDVIESDGILIFTPENLGYMSGLTKDFFDRIYYPCLDRCQGMPYALIVRAGHDGTGTQRAIESICTGLKWKRPLPNQVCRGDWQDEFITSCREYAANFAAGVDFGIF